VRINVRSAERRKRLNVFYILENHATSSRTANHPFIVYDGQSWTFQETYQIALRYGTWLRETHGVEPREIVAIDFMNSFTFICIILGIWSIGAIPAFINYNLSGNPLIHTVKTSSARLLLMEEEVFNGLPSGQLATFASSDFRNGKGPVNVVCFTPEVEAQVLQTDPIRVEDGARASATNRDMAILIYTSGTTGLPKPAVVSWRKCWAGGTLSSYWIGLRRTDRIFTVD
jgi:acyl-coenzyme A synthetase/AMP-(fatty) acid ligase